MGVGQPYVTEIYENSRLTLDLSATTPPTFSAGCMLLKWNGVAGGNGVA